MMITMERSVAALVLSVVFTAALTAVAYRQYAVTPPSVQVSIDALAAPSRVVAGEKTALYAAVTAYATGDSRLLRRLYACEHGQACEMIFGGTRLPAPDQWHGYIGEIGPDGEWSGDLEWRVFADVGLDGDRSVAAIRFPVMTRP